MVTQRTNLFLYILIALLGTACVVNTGRGSYDDDDASDDDDDASGTGPMELNFSISNSTGYDFTYFNWGFEIDGELVMWENTEGMTDGSVSSSSGTTEDIPYGVAMHVTAYALDTDNDCYNWEDGGQSFNTGAVLSIEVDFEFSDWLGSGVPCD